MKFAIGHVSGCPTDLEELQGRLTTARTEAAEGGSTSVFRVLDITVTTRLLLELAVLKYPEVPQYDPNNNEITTNPVQRAAKFEVAMDLAAGRVEVVGGGVTALQAVADFLTELGYEGVLIEPIQIDPLVALRSIQETYQLQVKSAQLKQWAYRSTITGEFKPKFEDTAGAIEFLEEVPAESLKAVHCIVVHPDGKLRLQLTDQSIFTLSAKEDNLTLAQVLVRQLV
jgi:hypothetical protein